MSKPTSIDPGASTLAYQLYVELEWVAPKVWRRFLVPITIDLPLLHATLLFGMGWQGGHIHEFVIGRDKYGPPEFDTSSVVFVPSTQSDSYESTTYRHSRVDFCVFL